VPLVLAAGCWWLALKCWPGDRAKTHAARLAAALRGTPPPESGGENFTGREHPAGRIPPEALGDVHTTPVAMDLARNDLGPQAPPVRRTPTIVERQCADACAATSRTTIQVDRSRAVYGPAADFTRSH
jgi:hypothetical protein